MPPHSPARQELLAIAEILLNPEASPSVARDAAYRLTDLFARQGGFSDGLAGHKDTLETYTARGKAIAPLNAARCAWEYLRTAKFLQGVHAAIEEARRRFPGQRIEVLYAGTGPYATLALPLMPLLSPGEVGFTLLDLHGHCLDSVRHLLEAFGYTEFATGFVECDAATYRHPPGRPLHVAVTETMQTALQKEPQVAITLNLAPQLQPGGLLVPERIEIRACLADPNREIPFIDEAGNTQGRQRVDLGRIFDLGLDTAQTLASALTFPWTEVAIPPERPAWAKRFMLLTHITTFGDIRLGDYDCSLNCPVTIRELHNPAPDSTVEFRYRIGEAPGFEHRRPNQPSATTA